VDACTGLRNRRALEEQLESGIARARLEGAPLSLVVLDLDDFKAVNDGWGHRLGDDCLREVAHVLQDAVRQPDACYRWAGDEFAVLLPGVELAAAILVGERVEHAVSSACSRPDGAQLGISFGAAELGAEPSGVELLEAADRALLSRKAARTKAPAHYREAATR
jgi:diguanylate cyclase (GGDEF)-like protein